MLSRNKKNHVLAQLSDRVLTVFFKVSEPPLLWRWDLEKNHSFSLSLHRQEGEWELGVTVAGGEFQPVAHFDDYEAAEKALLSIEAALMEKTKGAASCSCLSSSFKVGLVSLIVFVALAGAVFWSGHKKTSVKTTVTTEQIAPVANESQDKGAQEGVPLSADEVLGNKGR